MELKLQLPITIGELAKKIDVKLGANVGAAVSEVITSVKSIESADKGSVSFLADNPAYRKYLPSTKASVILTSEKYAPESAVPCLIADNPRLALAKMLQLCISVEKEYENKIHPSAVIGQNVTLGHNVAIGPNCTIADNCVLGDNTRLMSNVSIYSGTVIGDNCTVHSGTVLGSDGFGYEVDEVGNWFKMPHLGGLTIGNNVEIGSNTSIDRGMLDNTIIANGVVIDNLVQIGHNVEIGAFTAIAGCVGIAGSTIIGERCLIGGAACIAGHITITDKVYISGTTSVSHSITTPGIYSSGLPARENSAWRRSVARFNTIDSMAKRIRALEKKIQEYNIVISDGIDNE